MQAPVFGQGAAREHRPLEVGGRRRQGVSLWDVQPAIQEDGVISFEYSARQRQASANKGISH